MDINLNRDIIIDIDLNNGKIDEPYNASYYNTDSNIAFFYVKLHKMNAFNFTEYISKEDAGNYKVVMKIVKPKTLIVTELIGTISDDLDEDCAIYKFIIKDELMNEVGEPFCYISIYYNNQELVTNGFNYTVKQDPLGKYNLVLLNDPDMPLLKSLLEEIKNNVGGIDDGNVRDDKSFSSYKTTQIANNLSSQIKEKANLNSVFSMANMGQDIKEAMTGGSVAVVGVNSVLQENIAAKQVTPDKTSFLKMGKNMLIGGTTTGGYISWQTGEIVSDSGYAYSDYIPVTPGTRISLNYHNALAFYDISHTYVAGINGSGSNSKNYTLVSGEIEGQSKHGTYTVPTNACYIRISNSVSKKDVQLELGEVSTPYQKPYYYIEGLVEMDNRNIFIKKDNECTILTEKAKYIFKRVTDTSINVDAWRLYEGKLINDDGTEYTMWSNSDAEGAIQIVGEDDFVCGYHGDEKFETINIVVDGKPININNDYNMSFNNITIVSTSKVYHCNTSASASTQAFKRTKMLKFENDKVTISNRFKCLENLNINRASLALFQCRKSQDNTTIINKFSNNNDLILYDVPTTSTGTMPEQSVNMTQATFYTNCGVVDFKITKGYDHPKYMGYISNFNDQNRLKVYFDYIKGNTEVNVGDILQAEFEFSIT